MILMKCILHQSPPLGRQEEKREREGGKEKKLAFTEYFLKVGNVLGAFTCLFSLNLNKPHFHR